MNAACGLISIQRPGHRPHARRGRRNSTGFYRLAYLIGFKPWDRGAIPRELTSLVEGQEALSPGKAVDIGCGTGTQAIYLAQHGWQVTGVDIVDRVLEAVRRKAHAARVTVQWKRGDVACLGDVVAKMDSR